MIKTLVVGLASSLALVTAAPLASSAAAQGLQHAFFMRGQIVDASADSLIVCVGKEDGAQAGQILDVVRVSPNPGPRTQAFRRERVGQVRIEHVVDAHFAHATLVSGSAERHDLVELRRMPK